MSLKSGDKISGRVLHGDKVGRKMGFPTANLEIPELSEEDFGVYSVEVLLEKGYYKGVLSVGNKATFKENGTPLAECHIFDYCEDIYGKILEITVVEFIRPQLKFSSLEALKLQIAEDIQSVKNKN
ncbi:MAG: riboflavin kinase [Rikenellaceae bacterium]